jgi:Ca2+-binding RTX toxin-like protein
VTGAIQLPDVVACHGLAISIAALLAGATDADGDSLSVVGIASSSGTLTLTEDGNWQFERAPSMLGEVTLNYHISDGTHLVTQTAYFNVVEAAPIVGTEGEDNLIGTQCNDSITARGGDDNIDARGGDDRISGDDGNDHILGGAGNDVIYAGAGNDIVFAGAGNDVVFGGAGNDRLFGEDGDDTLMGEDGDDYLDGGAGRDILLAGDGDDVLDGGNGDDTLDGGEGRDRMAGGNGSDIMTGGAGDDQLLGEAGEDIILDGGGSDVVSGGSGNDVILAAADGANDRYDGNDGHDTLDYSTTALTVTIDLRNGNARGVEIGEDLIQGFEKIIAGSGDDQIYAGSGPVVLTGGAGNDVFDFGYESGAASGPEMVRKITDFTVGDKIVAAAYQITINDTTEAEEQVTDLFEQLYLEEGQSGNGRAVRFRFEDSEEGQYTVIDVGDGVDTQEVMTIEVAGHHQLQYAAIHS